MLRITANLAEKFLDRLRGRSRPTLSGANVIHDAGSRRNLGTCPDSHMIGNTHTSAQHNPIAKCHTTGKAAMGCNHAGTPDPAIVGNLHKIINFCAFTNDCVINGAAIYRRVGTNFNFVLDDDPPQLRHLFQTSCTCNEAKIHLTNTRTGVDNDVISNQGIEELKRLDPQCNCDRFSHCRQ